MERGHTLSTIAELAGAFDAGRDVGELLGLDRLDGPSPVRLAPEELADHFEGEVTPANLASALALGYVRTDGDAIVHISRRLLKASASLVREGVPLAVILDAAPGVRHHTEALAAILAGVAGACAADPRRLRPLVQSVVEAELSLALDRRLGADG